MIFYLILCSQNQGHWYNSAIRIIAFDVNSFQFNIICYLYVIHIIIDMVKFFVFKSFWLILYVVAINSNGY